jgi:hypothetical protein
LRPKPRDDDYLIIEWHHRDSNQNIVTSGQKYISGDELGENSITTYDIVFVPDPISARDIRLQMKGRFRKSMLPVLDIVYELSDNAVLIKSKPKEDGGYELVSI